MFQLSQILNPGRDSALLLGLDVWRTRVLLVYWLPQKLFVTWIAHLGRTRGTTAALLPAFHDSCRMRGRKDWLRTNRTRYRGSHYSAGPMGDCRLAGESAWRFHGYEGSCNRWRDTCLALSPFSLSPFLPSWSKRSRRQRGREAWVRLTRGLSPSLPFWSLRLPLAVSWAHPIHWYTPEDNAVRGSRKISNVCM